MNIKSFFKKKSKEFNCYDSIKNLPIDVWFDIHETGDLLLLFKEPEKAYLTDKLNILFDKIYNEFLEKFGLSEEYLTELEQKKYIAELQADYIITGQRHLRTLIAVAKERNNTLPKVKKPKNIGVILAQLGKYYGYHLNEKITVYQYYSHINALPKNG